MIRRLFPVALTLALLPLLVVTAEAQKPPDKKAGKGTKKNTKKGPGRKPGKTRPARKPAQPVLGKVYSFSPTAPTWAMCDVEFRDPSEERWPNFFYGRPVTTGTFKYDLRQPRGAFALNCDQQAQAGGDQGRRVLGELLRDGPITVTFTVRSLGRVQREQEETTDAKGRTSRRPVDYAPANAVLDVGGKQVTVKGKATYRIKGPDGDNPTETVAIDVRFKVRASDLGLKDVTGELDCRAGITGYADLAVLKLKKPRRR
jgi:hypothetical protein